MNTLLIISCILVGIPLYGVIGAAVYATCQHFSRDDGSPRCDDDFSLFMAIFWPVFPPIMAVVCALVYVWGFSYEYTTSLLQRQKRSKLPRAKVK